MPDAPAPDRSTARGADAGPTTRGADAGPTTRGADQGPTAHGAGPSPAVDGADQGPATPGSRPGPAVSPDGGSPGFGLIADGTRSAEAPADKRAQPGTQQAAGTTAGERTGFRLATFGAVLVVVLFAGYGLGRLNGGTTAAPTTPTATANAAMPGMTMDESQPHTHTTDGTVTQPGVAAPLGAAVGGLSLSSGGLTLVPSPTVFTAGKSQRLGFRITGAGGAPITTYAIVHDKPLHLVVIRRDLAGFQHLHPTMAPDGTWSIDLTLAEPGIYRMIADFTAVVGGRQVTTTLGSDLTVAGDYAPLALPAPVQAATTDGFAVGYEGKPSTVSTQPILVSVAGAKLEPYLGAFGHLVVLRQGDLAYIHVHPEAQLVDGKVKFWLAVPSSGTYRMFFDFQVAGQVHTASWTAQVS